MGRRDVRPRPGGPRLRARVHDPSTAPIGAQLTLVYRTRHGAEGDLGGPVERLMHLLTGKPPGALGPAEPLEHPWRRDRFTEFARGRSTARLLVVGDGPRPAQAICDFTTGPGGGVGEVSTVTVGYMPEDPPPLRHLPTLVGALAADQTIASLFVQLTPGRADLTTEPRWTGAPAPVALAVAGTVRVRPASPASRSGRPARPSRSSRSGTGAPRTAGSAQPPHAAPDLRLNRRPV